MSTLKAGENYINLWLTSSYNACFSTSFIVPGPGDYLNLKIVGNLTSNIHHFKVKKYCPLQCFSICGAIFLLLLLVIKCYFHP